MAIKNPVVGHQSCLAILVLKLTFLNVKSFGGQKCFNFTNYEM